MIYGIPMLHLIYFILQYLLVQAERMRYASPNTVATITSVIFSSLFFSVFTFLPEGLFKVHTLTE